MSVVAWDGKTLAADKRAENCGTHSTTTKMMRAPSGAALAWVGDQDIGLELFNWYITGADPKDWPVTQKDKDWARLIVAHQGSCWYYETRPFAVLVEDPFCAWGSGRDFALAAMHLGHDAIGAVAVACEFDVNCGNGISSLQVDP